MRTRNFFLLFFLVLFLPGTALAQGKVLQVSGRILTISVGSKHGVRDEMRGVVVSTLAARESTSQGFRQLHSGDTDYVGARFQVFEVDETTCRARVTGIEHGFSLQVGQKTLFMGSVTEPQPARKRIVQENSLENARKRATENLDRNDWNGALVWLRTIISVQPRDPVVRRAIALKRREASAALERGDINAAIMACDAGLDLLDDSELRALKDRAFAAGFSDQYGSTIAEANSLLERLRSIDAAPPNRRASVSEMADLVRRRAVMLRELVKVASGNDPDVRRPIEDLMREISGQGVVWVEAGEFVMGCTEGDAECQDDEKPPHRRAVDRFFLDATEVTVAQFRAYAFAAEYHVPPTPSFEQSSLHPVVNVSWEEAQAYCEWVGARLPTEAEWEYAARAGQTDWKYPTGTEIDHELANFQGVGGRDKWTRTAPVTSFAPNQWGLFEMAGNVWEWCADPYTANYIENQGDGSLIAGAKVLRGGSWLGRDSYMRVSSRIWYLPTRHMFNIGFRCARDVTEPDPTDEPQ
jgi:formylglycine-generating enzyme required for sulfatase activity